MMMHFALYPCPWLCCSRCMQTGCLMMVVALTEEAAWLQGWEHGRMDDRILVSSCCTNQPVQVSACK